MLDAATNPKEIRVVKQAINGLREDRKDHLPKEEPEEPYDPSKDLGRQEQERANRVHREGMPENTPRQDGLNKNGSHKNNRR